MLNLVHKFAIVEWCAGNKRRMTIPTTKGRSRQKLISNRIWPTGIVKSLGSWVEPNVFKIKVVMTNEPSVHSAVAETESATLPRPKKVRTLENNPPGNAATSNIPMAMPGGRPSRRDIAIAKQGATTDCSTTINTIPWGARTTLKNWCGVSVFPIPNIAQTSSAADT